MRTGFLTAVAIAAVAFSGVAHASVITENFTAFINSGGDSVGAFGAVGANLAGETVTFSFSYNAVLLQADGIEYSSPFLYDEYVDTAEDGAITESVTINSQTLAIASNAGEGAVYGCTATLDCGGPGFLRTYAEIASSHAYIQTTLYTNYSTSDNLFSQTEVDALVGGEGTTGTIYVYNGSTQDALAISNVSADSATPEPTTWISLALGFGMVGLLKRRRCAR
jgi:hypothetical protein